MNTRLKVCQSSRIESEQPLIQIRFVGSRFFTQHLDKQITLRGNSIEADDGLRLSKSGTRIPA